mmetsp:Transcript_4495/g.7740  ORF Transcript_4495/g.7740 Transcript_4495/m.7740 type:complete len:239 (+) Transcript_4495:158-874(+)
MVSPALHPTRRTSLLSRIRLILCVLALPVLGIHRREQRPSAPRLGTLQRGRQIWQRCLTRTGVGGGSVGIVGSVGGGHGGEVSFNGDGDRGVDHSPHHPSEPLPRLPKVWTGVDLEEPKAHSFVEHVIQAEVLKRSGQGLERGRPSLRGRPFTTVRRKELSRHGLDLFEYPFLSHPGPFRPKPVATRNPSLTGALQFRSKVAQQMHAQALVVLIFHLPLTSLRLHGGVGQESGAVAQV